MLGCVSPRSRSVGFAPQQLGYLRICGELANQGLRQVEAERRELVRPVNRHERFLSAGAVRVYRQTRGNLAKATSPRACGRFPKNWQAVFFLTCCSTTRAPQLSLAVLSGTTTWMSRSAWTIWLSRSVPSLPGGPPSCKFLAARHGDDLDAPRRPRLSAAHFHRDPRPLHNATGPTSSLLATLFNEVSLLRQE